MIEFLVWRLEIWIPLLLSLTVHEWAHARAAFALGDDTAASMGRMTLDPIVHIDPLGTLLLPLIGVPIGWAKPVPVRPERFRSGLNMKLGMALTAAAGPASNLIIAAAASPLLWLVPEGPVSGLVRFVVFLNLALALFNLLPIPPLDGGRILVGLLPRRLQERWRGLEQHGPVILAVVMIVVSIFTLGALFE